jgi:hypothetical protein
MIRIWLIVIIMTYTFSSEHICMPLLLPDLLWLPSHDLVFIHIMTAIRRVC